MLRHALLLAIILLGLGTALTRPAIDHDLEPSAPLSAIQESEEAIHGNVFLRATLGSFAGFFLGTTGGVGLGRLLTAVCDNCGTAALVGFAGGMAAGAIGHAIAGDVGVLLWFPAQGAITAPLVSDRGN